VLAKCATPFCLTPFRHFRDGKLFRLEVGSRQSARASSVRRPRWFWLCGQCAANLTLKMGEEGTVVLVPRTQAQEVKSVQCNTEASAGRWLLS
jgi:phage terminase large subunit GpA-like protein